MKLTIPRIVAILAAAMAVVLLSWEILQSTLGVREQAEFSSFLVLRGILTAVIMVSLAVFLMTRYRRHYEDELTRRSEEAHRMRVFFENIIKDAGDAILSLDNSGVIRFWNRAAERIYGYTSEEIVGTSLARLVPRDRLESGELERLEATLLRDGIVRNYETQRLAKDGRVLTVRLTRSILRDAEGRVVGSTAIVSDITSEKEMASRLLHAEKLAAIGQAAASTAHEVRNALAGIWGTVEVLERSPAWSTLPEEVGEEVKVQMGRIAHIINDLLSYARPGLLSRRRADIQAVLDRSVMAVSSLPEAKGRTVRRRYGALRIEADVDPHQLEQAFVNLIANACQAMAPGDSLEIITEVAGDGFRILFTDTGSGMPPDTLARALDPFFTTKAKGSGLGLAIVKTIVEAHDGAITLESAPAVGTTVTLSFPLPEAVRDERPIAEVAPTRVGDAPAVAIPAKSRRAI